MAALLKKRALAEYSQVIQEEPKPIKKLRLVQKPVTSEINLNLSSATNSQDVLNILLRFGNTLPIQGEQTSHVVTQILDHFSHEKETIVRCKMVELIGEMSKLPGCDVAEIINGLMSLLNTEKSHKVQGSIVESLTSAGQTISSSNTAVIQELVEKAVQMLKDSCHMVRSKCLSLIGKLSSNHYKTDNGIHYNIQDILANFTHDQDPRVRSSSLQAMLSFHQRGIQLDQMIYEQACKSLVDDHESGRMAAVKLIWVLSHIYPEVTIKSEDGGEDLRLIDDGFAKICNMMNDISMKVRAEAASLLGSLHLVSSRFLEQTLDKKLMSNMRRKKSASERAKEHYQSGEWSTGQKWADDKPKEELDAESVNLMNIGACGAFIHGLEDEFLEVRNAALDSLCELAAQSQQFSILSQDSIIDMFNDEIEMIRLNAINSLRKISHNIILREDQLDIILGVLQDYSAIVRETAHSMLGDVKLATKECVNACVMALLDNLQRYPQDKEAVWRCSRNIGLNHPHLTLTLVPDLLCIHPYFDTPEPDMDDPAYITVLMLVFNSAIKCPTMLPLFQEHTLRHYTYLRGSMPELVPSLDLNQHVEIVVNNSRQNLSGVLTQCVSQLTNLDKLDSSSVIQILELTVRDLERLKKLDVSISHVAECTSMFLHAQLLVTKLMSDIKRTSGKMTLSSNVIAPLDKVMKLTTTLQTLFLGISNKELSLIRQTELQALTIQLQSVILHGSLAEQLRTAETYINYLQHLQRFLETNSIQPDEFTTHLIAPLGNLEPSKLNIIRHVTHTSLELIHPSNFPINKQVRKTEVKIHAPVTCLDSSVKFSAGLTTGIPLDVTVENIENTRNILIQVNYPDQQQQLITPCLSHWRKLSPLRHRLTTQVIISHALWSESCPIEISLVMKVAPIPGRRNTKIPENIELCKPVEILVLTKPSKRA
ncbi:hypothetical protein LOTGIDRAFT_220695 [Lottia gigantea]|uniref:Uncharacterized protein n=1 Tax=Lottia gigantea TaxID=225164 RepID=V3ZV05_LOTGI|nr:hypothetical protein LOTGIDRAFT_220695 [Lottia gigantea]ESO86380.1 hypothetical protein LOTGIDRAFT_220695 [Lottia gigantea]